MSAYVEVLQPGPLTTVQDLGRPGYAHWGVSRSGAADRASARLANRLVGNPEGAACLEATLGGLRVRAGGDLVLATTGAPCPATVAGRAVATNTTFELASGHELDLATPDRGLRTYVAVRGGLDVAMVLGSRATDLLGGLGPEVVGPGTRLAVGDLSADYPPVDHAVVREIPAGEVELRVRFGPRADWFTSVARRHLVSGPWVAGTDSSRIGLRLTGPDLERRITDELPSEGVVRGALQVPPTGSPTIFLADHPVTGGYPVIAVVLEQDVDLAAQVRPGQTVRLRAIGSTTDR